MAPLEAHATERTIMMLDRLRGVFDSDALPPSVGASAWWDAAAAAGAAILGAV